MSSNESSAVLDSITPDKLIELAGELIKIPSFRREETPIAQWLAEYFGTRGYEVDLQEIDPGRFQTIATLKGSGGGKSLMFNGHIDIDALSLGWQRDPWTPSLEGDLLYGAGIANMKAGQSSMINAAEAIRTSGAEHKGDIIIACVAGHGDGGYGTVHMLNQGVRADMAVVPEPYGDRTLLTTHSGALQLAISTIGYAQHSSRRKYGIDALTHMRKVISKLQQMSFTCTPRDDMPELPILNVGGIIGGKGRDHKLTIPGFCADYCTVLVDVRYLPGQSPDSIRAEHRRGSRRAQGRRAQTEVRDRAAGRSALQAAPRPLHPDRDTGHRIYRPVRRTPCAGRNRRAARLHRSGRTEVLHRQ